jgi:hypothetical protein
MENKVHLSLPWGPFITLYSLKCQVKFSLYSVTHQYRTAYGGAEIRVHAFLTPLLGSNEYSDLSAGHFTPSKNAPVRRLGGLHSQSGRLLHGTRNLFLK